MEFRFCRENLLESPNVLIEVVPVKLCCLCFVVNTRVNVFTLYSFSASEPRVVLQVLVKGNISGKGSNHLSRVKQRCYPSVQSSFYSIMLLHIPASINEAIWSEQFKLHAQNTRLPFTTGIGGICRTGIFYMYCRRSMHRNSSN